jgi:protein tyrosine phosphatase (PTP) superfamily phosphohydrolase (DUF442 family)
MLRMHFEEKYFHVSLSNLVTFLFIWLLVGFSTGTAVLMGPVRWITTFLRNENAGQSSENLAVQITLVLFVLLSAYVALLLTRLLTRSAQSRTKISVVGICLCASAGALWFWMNPQSSGQGRETSIVTGRASFTFGPYPTQEHLTQLKREGYTDVISLLHPAVVPFEPSLLEDERKFADEIGLHIIHIPMLPWVSENEHAIAQIKDLAEHGKGKYYIHCYLGKDRINVVKRILTGYNVAVTTADVQPGRTLDEVQAFERGAITKLDEGIYLIPYPTDEEFLGYIFSGNVKQVVSLMDTSVADNAEWIKKEKHLMDIYQMPFEMLSVNATVVSRAVIKEIAAKVEKLPKPIVIHDFRSDSPVSTELMRHFTVVKQK